MATRAKKHEGSIYQEASSGRWVAAIVIGRENGRPRRRKVTGRTEAEVRTKLAELRNTVEHAPEHDGAMTVGAWLDAWLMEVERARSAGTHRNYVDVVNLYVRPFVGTIPLAKLKPADVDRMMVRLAELGKSPNTIRLARSVLRRALTRAVQRGMLTRNVALGQYVEGPKVAGTAAEARKLSPADLGALLATAEGHRLYAAVLVQAVTGLRSGEVLGLRQHDLDLDRGLVTVAGAVKRGGRWEEPKTRQSRRTIAVPSEVCEALQARLEVQRDEAEVMAAEGWANPDGLVFTTATGRPIDGANYRHTVTRWAEKAGLGHVHPHDLRHAAASLALSESGDLKAVSALLGHSSVRVTGDVYAHVAAGSTGALTGAIAARLGMGARE